ncbi:hypothetical protein H072_974 [Dactylellina haptotyla CBS 200.50]|uniref:Uncharacterized protein n=1 Tax=Dactylellina haptotyla (strain CBS 200.50) TaxID=1284197 RepID=S8AVK2_DACHA|nr:hypothetical protein H072_974 [Dactylellina haptotyla CBS 200.50]
MAPYPPLIQAVRSNDAPTVRKLLTRKPYPLDETAGRNAWTPLHFAAYYQNRAILQLLLSKNAPISTKETKDGFEPLHKAAERGNIDAIKILLDNGADIEATSNAGSTPLLVAVKFGFVPAVRELLFRGADINVYDSTGRSVAHIAAERGNLEMLEFLHANNAWIDLANVNGRTPLYLAVKGGHESVVKYLLDNGADVNAAGDDGWTPVHAAGYYSKPEDEEGDIMMLLLEADADVKAEITSTGYMPLHKAAEGGNLEVLRWLVNAGAEVNGKSKRGHTPLYAAVRFGKERAPVMEIVKFLVGKGADVGVRDQFGMGLVSIAKQRRWKELMEFLDTQVQGRGSPVQYEKDS